MKQLRQQIMITIMGQPIAKNRPRFARKGKYVKVYSDQETEEGLWILSARHQIATKYGQDVFFDGPVEITTTFWVQRPKSHYGTGKNSNTLKPSAPKVPISKPDCDNYLKFSLDCLNHCGVWEDDAFITDIRACKRYADAMQGPRTEIVIISHDRENLNTNSLEEQ
jgi:Holliday junction resolvase RusA-like endonuclease